MICSSLNRFFFTSASPFRLADSTSAPYYFRGARHLRTSNLILQQQCEGLSERGYIEPANHRVWGLHIALTREGRDFVIKQGFVR